MKHVLASALAALFLASPLAAAPLDLSTSAHATERLVVARTGDVLRKACPSASVRWIRVWREVEDLKAWARSQGHSSQSVKAFLDDKAQKRRIYGLADAYLAKAGYTGDAASACKVARAEVAGDTPVGRLLSVR